MSDIQLDFTVCSVNLLRVSFIQEGSRYHPKVHLYEKLYNQVELQPKILVSLLDMLQNYAYITSDETSIEYQNWKHTFPLSRPSYLAEKFHKLNNCNISADHYDQSLYNTLFINVYLNGLSFIEAPTITVAIVVAAYVHTEKGKDHLYNRGFDSEMSLESSILPRNNQFLSITGRCNPKMSSLKRDANALLNMTALAGINSHGYAKLVERLFP